jgi:hypothetical protein
MSIPNRQILVDIVVRQTNYTEEKAIEKLNQHNNDVLTVIREYMSPAVINIDVDNTINKKSINQQIYSEIRNLMDNAAATYKRNK